MEEEDNCEWKPPKGLNFSPKLWQLGLFDKDPRFEKKMKIIEKYLDKKLSDYVYIILRESQTLLEIGERELSRRKFVTAVVIMKSMKENTRHFQNLDIPKKFKGRSIVKKLKGMERSIRTVSNQMSPMFNFPSHPQLKKRILPILLTKEYSLLDPWSREVLIKKAKFKSEIRLFKKLALSFIENGIEGKKILFFQNLCPGVQLIQIGKVLSFLVKSKTKMPPSMINVATMYVLFETLRVKVIEEVEKHTEMKRVTLKKKYSVELFDEASNKYIHNSTEQVQNFQEMKSNSKVRYSLEQIRDEDSLKRIKGMTKAEILKLFQSFGAIFRDSEFEIPKHDGPQHNERLLSFFVSSYLTKLLHSNWNEHTKFIEVDDVPSNVWRSAILEILSDYGFKINKVVVQSTMKSFWVVLVRLLKGFFINRPIEIENLMNESNEMNFFEEKLDFVKYLIESECDFGNQKLIMKELKKREDEIRYLCGDVIDEHPIIKKILKESDMSFLVFFQLFTRRFIINEEHWFSNDLWNKRRRDFHFQCGNCGKSPDYKIIQKLKRCSLCKVERYCSSKCQNSHWKIHKKECKGFYESVKKFSDAFHKDLVFFDDFMNPEDDPDSLESRLKSLSKGEELVKKCNEVVVSTKTNEQTQVNGGKVIGNGGEIVNMYNLFENFHGSDGMLACVQVEKKICSLFHQ